MSDETNGSGGGPNPFSVANFAEIIFPSLDLVSARSVVEVGAYRGDFTRELLTWAEGADASITAIEPEPPPELLRLAENQPELELVQERSHAALARLPLADAVIIDGDHNYHTVSEELQMIWERAEGSAPPLLIFHDVCWPHARRDTYYAPEQIPEQHRQPLTQEAEIAPGHAGTSPAGIKYSWAAEREGGPRNGVLTAIEDFMEAHARLRLAIVPAFFGLGLMWSEDAPWAMALADRLRPWDSSPLIQRLEADRVAHIVDRIRLERQEEVLRAMLNSRAIALAEAMSRLRQRGAPVFSRERMRRALEE